jgi:hypothetical protein
MFVIQNSLIEEHFGKKPVRVDTANGHPDKYK